MKVPKTTILTAFFCVFTLFISCKSTKEVTPTATVVEPIVFVELNTGTNGGFTKKESSVITEQSAYNEAWFTAFDKLATKPKPARIDFENRMVLLVTMGECTSGGYSIKINSIVETQDNILVTIEESKPSSSCMNTSVITYPYQIVELNKSKKEVVFKTIEKVYECEK